MGIKGVPFGYLEFLSAIGGIMPTRARAPPLPPALLGPESGSGRGRVRCYNGSRLAPLPEPARCNSWKKLLQRLLSRTVAIVQTGTVTTFLGHFCPPTDSQERYK